MSAFNVVRFRVKPGRDHEFLDAHRSVDANWPGLNKVNMIKTGDHTYCIIAEWADMADLAAARPNMIATLSPAARAAAIAKTVIILRNIGCPPGACPRLGLAGRSAGACSSDHLKTWFVVLRIVGDQVLVEFECIPRVFVDACPNGTQTSMLLLQARSRLNAYAADSEKHFMEELQRPAPRFRAPRD